MGHKRTFKQREENITVTRSLAGGTSTKNNRNSYGHTKDMPYYILSREEGSPSGIFLPGGGLTTFLDFGVNTTHIVRPLDPHRDIDNGTFIRSWKLSRSHGH